MDSSNNHTTLCISTLFDDNKVSVNEFTEENWKQVIGFLKKIFSGSLSYYIVFKSLNEWLTDTGILKTSLQPNLFGSKTDELLRTECLLICEIPDTIKVWDSEVGEVSGNCVRTSEQNYLFVTTDFRWWNIYYKMEVFTDEESFRLGNKRPQVILSASVTEIEGDKLTFLLASRAYSKKGTSLTPLGALVLFAFNKFSFQEVICRRERLDDLVTRDRKFAEVMKKISVFPAFDNLRQYY